MRPLSATKWYNASSTLIAIRTFRMKRESTRGTSNHGLFCGNILVVDVDKPSRDLNVVKRTPLNVVTSTRASSVEVVA